MFIGRWFASSLCLICLACGSEGNRTEEPSQPWLDHPEREFPDRLSDVGLWDLSEQADLWTAHAQANAMTFSPRFPLWTNGARKQRYLVLPKGELIDASDPSHWIVPPGSVAFKTLYFADPDGNPVPTETRVIQIDEAGERRFAVYVWDEDLSDAARSEAGATLEVRDFGGEVLEHQVPSEAECSACHDSSPKDLLGLSGLQQQPGEQGALPDSAFLAPPTSPSRALRGDDVESRVLGYFVGNCAHCHNDWHGPNSEFSLLPDVAFDNLIGVESQGSASTDGIRVIPGDPANSLLFQALDSVQGKRRAKPMPPLGVQVEDEAGITLIEEWIEHLEQDD